MARKIPIHYLKEDSALDAEVTHLMPASERWDKLNGYDAHIDDCFTVIAVAQGSGTTDIDFRTVRLTAGQLGIIVPGQLHSNIEVKDCEAWMLRLSPDMIDNDYRHLIEEYALGGDVITLTRETLALLCDSMELLGRLLAAPNGTQPMRNVVFNMLNVILGLVTPGLIGEKTGPILRSTQITAHFKRLVRQFVRQHRRPSFYASAMCISEVYLNEAVKKSSGMTPSDWINISVILEAKRFLRSTMMSVKEVAHELGFEDHAYFSRMFKKNTGMTPMDFRATLK